MPRRERDGDREKDGKEKDGETAKEKRTSGSPGIAIEQMYQIYEKLNSAEDKTKLESEYRKFLDAVHRSDKEKRLASQFITRFVEYFPNLYGDAANAMLDLCEEEDINIRKQVLKDLITVCKKVKTCVPKIADVFCQLMYTADHAEMIALHTGLNSLFHIDAKGTLAGIFTQIKNGKAIVRDGCFKFLQSRLQELSMEIADFHFQKFLYTSIKQEIAFMSQSEFKIAMDILLNTKLMKQVSGQQLLVDLLCEQLTMDAPLGVEDKNNITRLFMTTDYAMPLFNSQISCNRFVVYYFTKVLPKYTEMVVYENPAKLQLGTLKRMDDLLFLTKQMDDADVSKCLPVAFNLALDILPIPQAHEEGDQPIPTGLTLTTYEAILYAIHRLGAMKPDFLLNEPKLDQFRSRLQYLNRTVNAFDKKLRAEFTTHLETKDKKLDLSTPENRKKIHSLKVIKNLNGMIRDLFQKPAKYTATVNLSWKPMPNKRAATTAAAVEAPSKVPRVARGRDREIPRYQPPGGKYSRGSTFSLQPSTHGTGRGRGGWRGGSYRGGGSGMARRF